jgi:hypothetical protein
LLQDLAIFHAGDGHPADRKCTEYTGALLPASFRKCCFWFLYLDYVLFCKIIIILNMEIVGNPKLLGARPEQQAAGPVSNPQQQQQQQKSLGASAVSGQGLPQQAAPHTNAGYRSEGGDVPDQ